MKDIQARNSWPLRQPAELRITRSHAQQVCLGLDLSVAQGAEMLGVHSERFSQFQQPSLAAANAVGTDCTHSLFRMRCSCRVFLTALALKDKAVRSVLPIRLGLSKTYACAALPNC